MSALCAELDEIRSAVQKHSPKDGREHAQQLRGIVDYFRLEEFSSINALQIAVSGGEDKTTVEPLIDELVAVLRKNALVANEPSPDQATDS